MDKLEVLAERVRTLKDNLGGITRKILEPNKELLLDMEKDQLLRGLGADGEPLTPSYTQDLQPMGFFKSPESAKRYADYKRDKIQYPEPRFGRPYNREDDNPNLYYNGKFHSELGLTFTPDGMVFDGATPYAKGIIAKYGFWRFGLSPEYMSYVQDNIIKKEIKNYLLNGTITEEGFTAIV